MEQYLWDWRYGITVILALIIYCLFNWSAVKVRAYKGMLQAKSLAKDLVLNSGIEQENWVVDNVWPILPIGVKVFVNRDVFRCIVKKLYATAKDLIDDGKLNGTNGAAGEGSEHVPIRHNLMPISNYRVKSPHGIIAPHHITIHNTANDAAAASEIHYMSRIDTGNNVSFHYAVDDLEIVQGLPEDRSAIHAGTTAGNKDSIGIEICYSKSGGAKFILAEKNAAWLAAKILHERGWGIDRVRTHKSWSGKDCPHLTLQLGWQRFLNMVSMELATYNAPIVVVPSTVPVPAPVLAANSFLFHVTCDDLNVRSAPNSTTAKIITVVHKGDLFTITELSGKWGKLKSGMGWIHTGIQYGHKE